MAKRQPERPPLEPREFRSPEEIDAAIAKLRRRIDELEKLDIKTAILEETGANGVARSNVRETIRDVFGTNSPEFNEHRYIDIWAGPMYMNMSRGAVIEGTERGRVQVIGILNGLIGRLKEKSIRYARRVEAPSRELGCTLIPCVCGLPQKLPKGLMHKFTDTLALINCPSPTVPNKPLAKWVAVPQAPAMTRDQALRIAPVREMLL